MYSFVYDEETFYRYSIPDDKLNFLFISEDKLDSINLNIIFCIFLMSCVISLLYRNLYRNNKEKYKRYVVLDTLEPKITQGTIIA
jgi:hypothetical protein